MTTIQKTAPLKGHFMNTAWYLLRPFYAVGLFPVVLLLGIALFSSSKDPEVTVPVFLVSAGYFALGYLVFSVIPRWLKSRLLNQVHKCAPNFKVDYEAVSSVFNRYVGFNREAKKLVYVDISDGTSAMLDFPAVSAWEVETNKGKPALLKLMTSVDALPLIGVRFDHRHSNELIARLAASFG
ncbi:hypothetical protein [Pseudomonas cedrina]|uniref:hypothetical protein n=1 Tax=Pseudomonas cedrina TaxID=651740 RepID=UPI00277EE927|nr:hypothetical protein [Pseudomonas cedrina]MDQ0655195.1 hypothetical protein [Pseudomonas cedrina]